MQRVPLALAIAAVVACALCLAEPWFTANVVGTNGAFQMGWEYGLFGGTWTGPPGPLSPSAHPFVTETLNYSMMPRTVALFAATTGLVSVGGVLGASAVLGRTRFRHRPRLEAAAPWLSLAAATLLLLAPLMVALFFATAQAADFQTPAAVPGFWGTMPYFTMETGEGTEYWGAGMGWYLSAAAGAMLLAAGLLLLRERRQPTSVTQEPTRDPAP